MLSTRTTTTVGLDRHLSSALAPGRQPMSIHDGRWAAAAAVAAVVAVITSGAVLFDRHDSNPSDGGTPGPQRCDHLVRGDSSGAAGAQTVDLTLDHQPKTDAGDPIRVIPTFARPGGFPLNAVVACQYGEVKVEGANSSNRQLSATTDPGHLQVRSDAGNGLLAPVDPSTTNREADDGSGAQDFVTFPGWYVTFVDPQPGTYHFSRNVTWSSPAGVRQGTGKVGVTITLQQERVEHGDEGVRQGVGPRP